MQISQLTRRGFITTSATGIASAYLRRSAQASHQRPPTEFQLACMTLPYSQCSFARALQGIREAGFRFVALGTTHRGSPSEKPMPILTAEASEADARSIASQCRDQGLEPLMMFSMIYPEHPDGLTVLTQRLRQAAAAGIPQVLTFGHTQGGNRKLWIDRFKTLGRAARDLGVMLVVKQHGGETGTGKACAEITREVNESHIKVNYDAGNVMDYLDLDPIQDIQLCVDEIRSFCLKDHRNWPKDEDCCPGFGEIDHYRLLSCVAHTGMRLPLCFENISPPLLTRTSDPQLIDEHARRARTFMETVIQGIQRHFKPE